MSTKTITEDCRAGWLANQLFTHKTSALNRNHITVTRYDDAPGPGGAHHEYGIYVVSAPEAVVPPTVVLRFQKGPVEEAGVNGITEEALLAVVIDRLQGFQRGPYSCRQNALALTKLEEALHWLGDRTREREFRGVEGTSRI